MKKYQSFLSDNYQFFAVKFSIYLNRHVFVMKSQKFGNETHDAHVLASSKITNYVFVINRKIFIIQQKKTIHFNN